MAIVSYPMNKENPSETPSFFASAKRTPPELIDKRAAELAASPLIGVLLNAVSDAVVIVDEHRQIVFANENFIPLLPAGDLTTVLGLRPGEALGCVHSYVCEGCGTSKKCRECGAVDAILAALANKKKTGSCTLFRSNKGEVEIFRLKVRSTPFTFNHEKFGIISFSHVVPLRSRPAPDKAMLKDISEIERRAEHLRERLLS